MVDLKFIKPSNLWYVIGLIVTDGNLSKDSRHINITSKDRRYLFSVRKALGITNKIGKKGRSKSKEKIYSVLQFSDTKFYKYLLSIGVIPKKSLKLGEIEVKIYYFPDFLRGVIDGDGCISTWIHKSNQHRQWSLRITSAAPMFIKWLKNKTEDYFNIKGRLYRYKYKDKKNPIYILKFGKLPTKIILKSAYYKNALSLQRKNQKKLICLQDKNRMINYGNIIRASAGIGRQPRLKIE